MYIQCDIEVHWCQYILDVSQMVMPLNPLETQFLLLFMINCSLKAAITKHENTVHVYIHNPSKHQYSIPKYN